MTQQQAKRVAMDERRLLEKLELANRGSKSSLLKHLDVLRELSVDAATTTTTTTGGDDLFEGLESQIDKDFESIEKDSTSSSKSGLNRYPFPSAVIDAYMHHDRIEKLHSWQIQVLDKILQTRCSVIFVAPTSGGKSLIGELAILTDLMFDGRKGIFVLPHIAICEEKLSTFYTKFGSDVLSLRLGSLFAGNGGQWNPKIDVTFCTAEKLNMLLNQILSEFPLTHFMSENEDESNLIGNVTDNTEAPLMSEIKASLRKMQFVSHPTESIGTIVIDEAHEIADSNRGYLLEICLTKINVINTILSSPIRVACLSGSIENAEEIGQWLGATVCKSDTRPQVLDFFVKLGRSMFLLPDTDTCVATLPLTKLTFRGSDSWRDCRWASKATELLGLTQLNGPLVLNDPEHLGSLCYEIWKRKETSAVLVFCNNRLWVEKLGFSIARLLVLYSLFEASCTQTEPQVHESPDLAARLRDSDFPTLSLMAYFGVGFHHGGLSSMERRLMEMGLVHGTLKVVCSTSTLAMGVNLPISRIIFRNVDLDDAVLFHQVSGRAGRASKKGEIIVIGKDDFSWLDKLKLLCQQKAVICKSVFAKSTPLFVRFVLDMFVLRPKFALTELIDLLMTHSLGGRQSDSFSGNAIKALAIACRMKFITAGKQPKVSWIESCLCSPFYSLGFFDLDETEETAFRDARLMYRKALGKFPIEHLRRVIEDMRNGVKIENDVPLLDLDFAVSGELTLSPLGRGVIESGLRIPEATEAMHQLLKLHLQGVKFHSLHHLIYSAIPPSAQTPHDWSLLLTQLTNPDVHLTQSIAEFARDTLKLDLSILKRLRSLPNLEEIYDDVENLGQERLLRVRLLWRFAKFQNSLLIYELVELENPIITIAQRHKVSVKQIINLTREVGYFSHAMSLIAASVDMLELSALLRFLSTKIRAYLDVSTQECSELQQLPILRGSQRAAALWEAGFTSIGQLATASVTEIFDALTAASPFEFEATESLLRRRKCIAETIKLEASDSKKTLEASDSKKTSTGVEKRSSLQDRMSELFATTQQLSSSSSSSSGDGDSSGSSDDKKYINYHEDFSNMD